MKTINLLTWFIGVTCLVASTVGCDSGFGEPCEVPKTAKFEKACGTVANRAPSNDDAVRMTSRASCAVKNFAGCSTRVCMVYRGSSPYCTTPCTSSDECEGSAVCRPLVGEAVTEEEVIKECDPSAGAFATECYCVREGDTVSGGGAAAAAAAAAAPTNQPDMPASMMPAVPMTMPNSMDQALPASAGGMAPPNAPMAPPSEPMGGAMQ